MRRFALPLAIVAFVTTARAQDARQAAWDSVGTVIGAPPAPTGGYIRYNLPRRDLVVMVGDVRIAAGLALGGWVGFDGPSAAAMMMGDLVVTAAELPAVERALIAGGISITAVHNHLVGESPQVMYVHLHGHGEAMPLARAVDKALAATATPRRQAAPPSAPQSAPQAALQAAPPPPLSADTALVFAGMGQRGRGAGAVASVSLELVKGAVTVQGMAVPAALAAASPVNVQFVSATRAVATGDFAVTERQLDPLVRALVSAGITVTAVHSHLSGESPRLLYVHFWGDGPPAALVQQLRQAADAARAAL